MAKRSTYQSKQLPDRGYELEQIQELVAKWQKVLRLEDWKIMVEIVSHHDLQDSMDFAETEVFFPKMYARMRFQPLDTLGSNVFPPTASYDVPVVHELLHIPLHRLYPETDDHPAHPYRDDVECAIERIAIALVTLDKQVQQLANTSAGHQQAYDELAKRIGPEKMAEFGYQDLAAFAADTPLKLEQLAGPPHYSMRATRVVQQTEANKPEDLPAAGAVY